MAFAIACKLCDGDWDLADALLERLEALARRLVLLNWPVVEAIAAALSEKGELTGAEIDQLLEPRPLRLDPVAQAD
jgi:hypothetical protein